MATRWTDADLSAYRARTQLPASASTARVPRASQAAPQKARTQKYRNRRVRDAEGNVHDSTKQYRRWCDLELRRLAGEISELRREPVFELVVNDRLVCKYQADASYIENGALVVEDVKPTFRDEAARRKYQRTLAYRHYRIKAALMRACYGIEVKEV